jgi:hypothetical protein
MTKIFLSFFCATALLGASVFAQDSKIVVGDVISTKDQIVKPIGDLTVYANGPSPWFGNTFNSETGKISVSELYEVVDTKELGTFSGAQLWVELNAVDAVEGANGPCSSGCWAYLGDKSSEVVLDAKILPDVTGINYGNFIFLDAMNAPPS